MSFELKIERDDQAENPRAEWDCFGHFVCWNRSHNIGDEDVSAEYRMSKEDFIAELKRDRALIIPVYLFDHSGITVSTSAEQFQAADLHGWDWGQSGFIYCLPEEGRKEFGRYWKTKARNLMESEIKTLDQYCTGDVWGYTIEDEDGEYVDCCWDLYGEEYCREEGERMLKHYKEEDFKKHGKQQDMLMAAGVNPK